MLAYICSRYRADTQEQFETQLAYTKEKAREEVMLGRDVVVPHLYYPQFLDDNDVMERELGMESAINLMKYCDLIIVCIKYGKSAGMLAEIKIAEENNMRIVEVI